MEKIDRMRLQGRPFPHVQLLLTLEVTWAPPKSVNEWPVNAKLLLEVKVGLVLEGGTFQSALSTRAHRSAQSVVPLLGWVEMRGAGGCVSATACVINSWC